MDAQRLSDVFGLGLYGDNGTPVTCRQMFEGIATVFGGFQTTDVTTRDALLHLYRRYQLIPAGYRVPGMVRVEKPNRPSLLRFCSEMAVVWLQPYFAQKPEFYAPDVAAATGCRWRALTAAVGPAGHPG